MLFIKSRHIKALIRKDLGVIVSSHVCRFAKGKVIKQMEEKYKKEFNLLNDHPEKLKATNLGSTVIVISKKATRVSEPIVDRMYICFAALKKVFWGDADILYGWMVAS